jgi:hypothetical protein
MARAPSKTPTVATASTLPPVVGTTVNVDYMRPDLEAMLPKYTLIRDCVSGSEAVKAKGPVYLPMPNAHDTSPANQARYLAYKTRAIFYGVSERTLAGMVGQVFNVDAIIKVPANLDAVTKDASGDGVTLIQQAQACEEAVLEFGRAGLLIDYPKTNGVVTVAEQVSGNIKPTINLYQPDDIINWRTVKVGSKIELSLVVLRESYEKEDDGFEAKFATQYRVLKLENGLYVQDVWRGEKGSYAPVIEYHAEPTGADGQRLKSIPFTFVGAVDNSPKISQPPMYAICDLNIGHYRNSADYEESVYMTGQATPVLAGLSERWVNEVLKGQVELGSRAAIVLPENATASLLQMEERSAAFEAMEHKEKQMVALGAKLVEQKTVQRTATEVDAEEAAETSILGTITKNVSAAYKFALEWAAIFQGGVTIQSDANTADDDNAAIVFELNTDFSIATMTAEEVNTAINSWQKEAITFKEMRAVVKKAGFATQDDDQALEEIRNQRMEDGNFDRENGLGDFANPEGDGAGQGAE